MKDEILEARLVFHSHNPKDWRLRNMEKHPIDPNWESGTYSKCSIKFRSNKNLRVNSVIFDLTIHNYEIVIRSAFIIKKIENTILYFDSFLFADKDPLVIPKKLFSPDNPRNSLGNKISNKEALDLLSTMKSHSYNEYKIGTKPNSIKQKDWAYMISKTTASKSKKHICYNQLKFSNKLEIIE